MNYFLDLIFRAAQRQAQAALQLPLWGFYQQEQIKYLEQITAIMEYCLKCKQTILIER